MKDLLNNDLFEAFATSSDHVYIYVCDMHTDLSRWSRNAVDYFGMPAEYMEHAAGIWQAHIHPDDVPRYLEDIGRVFSGESDHHKCEYRARNRYGDYVWLECRGSVLRNDANEPTLFAGMMTRLDAQNKYDPLTTLKTIHEFNLLDFSHGHGAILLVGFDDFRAVVNSYGYAYGNRVLIEFASRLEECCGEQYFAYRMQGDEFLVVLSNATSEEATCLFENISQATHELGASAGVTVDMNLSGGMVLYPNNGIGQEELLRNLEHSMEHAKASERGHLVVFSTAIADRHSRAIRIRQALTTSIRNDFDGFELYFQPIVSGNDHLHVACCEALLRWRAPEGETVSTAEVIEMLEWSGEIGAVGRWVARSAMEYAKRWTDAGLCMMVGFNVSGQQFKDPDLTDYLINTAKELDLNPRYVCMELTESTFWEEGGLLAAYFQKLRDVGFCLSLDDFGIAHSTLLRIRNLPVDSVKIDHAFVRNLSRNSVVDLAIVESIIQMCRKLNLEVVVEGIETREILDIISEFPVVLLQGYYFARPMPADQFEQMLIDSKKA